MEGKHYVEHIPAPQEAVVATTEGVEAWEVGVLVQLGLEHLKVHKYRTKLRKHPDNQLEKQLALTSNDVDGKFHMT